MGKNIIIVSLLIAVAILASALIRVENQRYALSLGFCPGKLVPTLPDMTCIQHTKTRTAWWWHLYYAILE